MINQITLDAQLVPYQSDECVLALDHLQRLAQVEERARPEIWLMDMGYPAFYWMALLLHYKREFVIRVYPGFCTEVDAFLASGASEGLIEIDVFAEGRGSTRSLGSICLLSRPVSCACAWWCWARG